MDILFIHNNFPAQYRALAARISQDGHRLFAIAGKQAPSLPFVNTMRYALPSPGPKDVHPFAARFDGEGRRAEAVAKAALHLRRDLGVEPSIVMVHPGWGEALPVRQIFPDARVVAFCEFWYRAEGADCGFDPEFGAMSDLDKVRVGVRNAAMALALTEADAAVSPTEWQRSLHPDAFRARIEVVHDGIDTDRIRPGPAPSLEVGGIEVRPGDEVVTFVARNLEPYRGVHQFFRALPAIQSARPSAKVVVVGGEGVSYGSPAPGGRTWKDVFLDEVRDRLDFSRIAFAGQVDYASHLALLRHSTAHVYLTYPFVLSWSMLEAMASGCVVVGSDTAPVREVIEHGRNGLLVPFFDPQAIAQAVAEACADRVRLQGMRSEARATVLERYDLRKVCLPRQLEIAYGGLSRSGEEPILSTSSEEAA